MNRLIMKQRNLKKRKGFTLIELIVVIAILGILAAVLVPQLSGFTKRAEKAQVYTNAAAIGTAADAMKVEGTLNTDKPEDVMSLAGLTQGTDDDEGDGTLSNLAENGDNKAVSFTYKLGDITVTRDEDGNVT